MKRMIGCKFSAVAFTLTTLPFVMSAEVLDIGQGKTHETLCAGVAAASPGDTLTLHGALQVSSECTWDTSGLQIRGTEGSSVRAEGGVWTIVADDTSIEDLELIDTGIEMSGRNLTLRQVVIHGAAVGVRSGDSASGRLIIERAKFHSNSADIQAQNGVTEFRLIDSHVHSTAEGASIMAGAALNVIEGNRIVASSNDSSRADLLLQATSDNVVQRNLFVRPAESAAYPTVLYVTDGTEARSFEMINNTFSNESDLSVKFVEVSGENSVRATLNANIFWGSGAVDDALALDRSNNYLGEDDIFIAGSEFRRNPAVLPGEWGANLSDQGHVPTVDADHSASALKSGSKSALGLGIAGFALAKTSVTGAGVFGGNTLILSSPAPTGGVSVPLVSSNPLVAIPYSPAVYIPAGQTRGYFYMKTFATTYLQTASIRATLGASTRYVNISVGPVSLTGIAPERTVLGSGLLTVQNLIKMSGPVPSNTAIALSSSSPLLTVPSSVTIAQGTSTNAFSMTARYVTSPVSVTLTARHATGTKSIVLTIAPVALKAASFLYPTVVGGGAGYLKVYLTGPAPSAGAPISLSSSDPSVYAIPSVVTVPAGKNEVLLATRAGAVTTSRTVTVTCSYQGVSMRTTLTIKPY